MRKNILLLLMQGALISGLVGCGGASDGSSSSGLSSSTVSPVDCATVDINAGKAIYDAEGSCTACHKGFEGSRAPGFATFPPIDADVEDWKEGGVSTGLALNDYIAQYMNNRVSNCNDKTCADNVAAYIKSLSNKPWCSAESSISSEHSSQGEVSSSSSSESTRNHFVYAPGMVQSESFNRASDTTANNRGDCGPSGEVDYVPIIVGGLGQCDIGFTDAGEWLEYDISNALKGKYDVVLSLSSSEPGKEVSLSVDGVEVGQATTLGDGWGDFSGIVIENIILDKDQHSIRITFKSAGVNFDAIELKYRGVVGLFDDGEDQCNSTAQCKVSFGMAASDCKNAGSDTSICMCGSAPCEGVSSAISAEKGKEIYAANCKGCHGENGEGALGFPSLQLGKCRSCSNFDVMRSVIELSMPKIGPECTGDCATNVALYISENFTQSGDGFACLPNKPNPGRTPLRRLSKREYVNSIVDLFEVDADLAASIPEEQSGGFDTNEDLLIVSELHVESYQTAARAIAQAVRNKQDSFITKFPNCGAKNDACMNSLISNLGEKVFRRPLDSIEKGGLKAVFVDARKQGFGLGFKTLIEALLQDPAFLYRLEFGDAASLDDGVNKISNWEMASRLSYMFWASTPDDELLQAAKDGKLLNKAEILSQAQRLLDSPRAKPVLMSYFTQWMGLDDVLAIQRSAAGFMNTTPALLKLETETFINHVVWNASGSLEELLTADYTFANDELATFYGVNHSGSAFTKLQNPSRNYGLLSQGSFNAVHARDDETAPILRGAFVLEGLMCAHLSEPPSGVDSTPPDVNPNESGRNRWTLKTSVGACNDCHRYINPTGFTLEHFDQTGRWREKDSGHEIDTSAILTGLEDLDGSYAGIYDFTQALSKSELVAKCFVTKVSNFSLGRNLDNKAEDGCSVNQTYGRFKSNGKNVKQLLLDITQSDAFLYRYEVK